MLTIPLGPHGVEKNIVMGKVVNFECLKSLTSLCDPREREPCATHLYILHSV